MVLIKIFLIFLNFNGREDTPSCSVFCKTLRCDGHAVDYEDKILVFLEVLLLVLPELRVNIQRSTGS